MHAEIIPKAFADAVIAFSWKLCQSNKTRSYPLFPDQTALEAEYRKSAAHPGGLKACCYHKGVLRGVLFGFAEDDNQYIQTTGFYVAENDFDAADALSAWLAENSSGYTVNIGLPADNVTIAAVLQARGYQLLDDALDLRLKSREFREAKPNAFTIRRIGKATLPRYLEFHQQHFSDCYWNAQRLREHFADWSVYALETDSGYTGGLFLREYAADAAEIYGLHTETEPAAIVLLSRAIGDLFTRRAQITSVLFMADTTDKHAIAAALPLGFSKENHYRCYVKTL
jgi:hypothetical protein